jgi:hypothetical protein
VQAAAITIHMLLIPSPRLRAMPAKANAAINDTAPHARAARTFFMENYGS